MFLSLTTCSPTPVCQEAVSSLVDTRPLKIENACWSGWPLCREDTSDTSREFWLVYLASCFYFPGMAQNIDPVPNPEMHCVLL